jgi:hypothetical protein
LADIEPALESICWTLPKVKVRLRPLRRKIFCRLLLYGKNPRRDIKELQ